MITVTHGTASPIQVTACQCILCTAIKIVISRRIKKERPCNAEQTPKALDQIEGALQKLGRIICPASESTGDVPYAQLPTSPAITLQLVADNIRKVTPLSRN